MHWTLVPSKSVALAALFATISVVIALFTRPTPLAQIAVGLVAGVVVGLFQSGSLRQTPSAYRAAETTMAVRRAMTSTRAGRMALLVQWVAAFLLLAVSFLPLFLRRSGSPNSAGLGLSCGYFALMAARDLTAMPGLARLSGEQPPCGD